MTNKQIAELFRNVATAYTIKNEKKYYFQIIAYQRAADVLENSTSEASDLLKKESLQELPGIGLAIKSYIEELLATGKVARFKWVFENIPESIYPLLKIPGFGPKKAYKLVKILNLSNPKTVIDDLEKAGKNNKIAVIEGFGEKSQLELIRSIKQYKKGVGKKVRMTLPYANELAEKIINYLKQNKEVKHVYALGSLRRMVSTVGDIDIAVASDEPMDIIDYFTKYPYKERVIEEGKLTASILVSGGHQVDLMVQPVSNFGALLQHFTGSKEHNIHLREYALKLGLSLSEYGIKKVNEKNGKIHSYSTEQSFYSSLGLDWIPPEIRENNGEIELAIGHKLPELVDLNNIKGDLHLHSNYPIEPSHDLGISTMEYMVKKAINLKYEYIGFSEHNPSLSNHNRLEIQKILQKRNEKIEQIKKSNKDIRIFKLLEVDILPNGNLAIDDDSLNLLDFVIVSIHSSFGMDKKKMTNRIISGLSRPKAKILAHPSGRLINQRPAYDLDWDELFNFCKTNNKILEINSYPNRLDLTDDLVKIAVHKGVKLVINTDSHSVSQMENMMYGVSVARRGWAKQSDVINTLTYNDIVKTLNI